MSDLVVSGVPTYRVIINSQEYETRQNYRGKYHWRVGVGTRTDDQHPPGKTPWKRKLKVSRSFFKKMFPLTLSSRRKGSSPGRRRGKSWADASSVQIGGKSPRFAAVGKQPQPQSFAGKRNLLPDVFYWNREDRGDHLVWQMPNHAQTKDLALGGRKTADLQSDPA